MRHTDLGCPEQQQVGKDPIETTWIDHLPADARRRNQLGEPILFSSKPAAFGALVSQPAGSPAESELGSGVIGLKFTQPPQRYDPQSICTAGLRAVPKSGLMLRSAAHACRPLPGARTSSQTVEGLQHVNMKALGRRAGPGERLASHPLVSQSRSPRKPEVKAAAASSVESAKSAQGRNEGTSGSFSFSGGAQGFAPQHAARGGIVATHSATAGVKRHHGDASPTDNGAGPSKRKKKKKKKVQKEEAGRFSFK